MSGVNVRGKRVGWILAFLLTCGTLGAQTETVLHYRFTDATSLGAVDDLSFAGNDGSAGPDAALSVDVPFTGLGNRSLDSSNPTTNSSGISTVGTSLLHNTLVSAHGGYTMECWFRWDGGALLQSIIDYAGTEKITVDATGTVRAVVGDFLFGTVIGTATAGQWHYVAVVFDTQGQPLDVSGEQPGFVTTYFDGIAATGPAEAATKSNFGDALNRPIAIGMHAVGQFDEFLNGRVFEPRVTLGALPPTELLIGGTPGNFLATYQLNEDATIVGDVIRLTPAVTGMEGSAWTREALPILGHSFQAFFSFRMTIASGTGADGVVFAVQNDPAGASAIGSGGGGLGIGGIEPSISIVFDSFEGASGLDHEIRYREGDAIVQEVPAPFILNDGNLHYSWIEYDAAAEVLDVYIASSPTRPATPVLTQSGVDLASIVGASAYFGVTGSTGGLSEEHTVESIVVSRTMATASDECIDATLFVGEGTWPIDTRFATTGADVVPGGCAGIFHRDIWVTYVPTFTGNVRVETCGLPLDADLAVYSGDCGSLVGLGCASDGCGNGGASLLVAAIAGDPLRIRIGGTDATAEGPVILSVATVYPDECFDAPIELVEGTWPIDTRAATTGTEPISSALCPGTFLGAFDQDIWMTYTASEAGDTRIATCGSFFDTDLAVYVGSCGSLLPVACNGDACLLGDSTDAFASEVIFPVVPGETYLVRIGGWSAGDAGLGTVTLEERYVPPSVIGSYRVSGTITGVSETSPSGISTAIASFGEFAPGDTYTLTFRYDTRIPPTFGSDVQSFFDDSLLSARFALDDGGYASSATTGRIFQRNFDFGDNFNLFNIGLGDHAGEIFGEAGGFDLLTLGDDDGGNISDASEVLNPIPGVEAWDDKLCRLQFGSVPVDFGGFIIDEPKFQISCTVDSIVRVACELDKVVPADAVGDDHNGIRVDIDGFTAIGGAYKDDDVAPDAGSARIYEWNGQVWLEGQKLVGPDGAQGDFFGWSVAIEGDVAVVGAQAHDALGAQSGAVYVFRNDGTNWVFEQKLTASNTAAGDQFGYSVALSGDVIIVGAPFRFLVAPDTGTAYAFRYNGSTWVEEAELAPSFNGTDDRIGQSVTVDGDVAVVGSPGSTEGRSFIFRYDGVTWLEEAVLQPFDGAIDDEFGRSVSLAGPVLVVGAPFHDSTDVDAGAAYAYRYDGAAWQSEGKLTTTLAGLDARFGWDVSTDGDTVLVSTGRSDLQGAASGMAVSYASVAGVWSEDAVLAPSDGAPGDEFGYDATVDGDFIIVGAYRDDDNGLDTGAVYFFGNADLTPPTLSCSSGGGGALPTIDVSWVNESTYLAISVFLDGVLVETLSGDATGTQVVVTSPSPDLTHEVCLIATTVCSALAPTVCCTAELGDRFIRGDCNGNGGLDIADAIAGLSVLFTGGEAPCLRACDVNADLLLNIADPIYLLGYLFTSGAAPPTPFPGCDVSPLASPLTCDDSPACP